MPWEKSFDVDEALELAADVFTAKGYEGASMSDLVRGMGINKGSLYNAFGSKKELFKSVLKKFHKDNLVPTLSKLEDLDDPVLAVATLFDTTIAHTIIDSEKKGNLVVNTALELPNHDDDVGQIVRSSLYGLEVFFKETVKLGQERGSIPASIDAGETAKSLVALMCGLRVLSRGAYDASGLLAIKSSAMRLIGNDNK